jgi:SAM-dependent methyltransferase
VAESEGSTDPEQTARATLLEGELLRSALSSVRSGRLLDVGCGRGRLAPFLELGALTYVGLDRTRETETPARVASARRRSQAFVVCEAQRLPFADESFDAAVLARVYHRLADPDETLRELRRVLRRGGLLILSVEPRPSLFTLSSDLGLFLHEPGRYRPLTVRRSERVRVEWGANEGYVETLPATLRRLSALGFTPTPTFAFGFEDLPIARHLPLRTWSGLAPTLRRFPLAPSVLILAR